MRDDLAQRSAEAIPPRLLLESWAGADEAAAHAARAGCRRIGTEHLLLTMLHGTRVTDPASAGADAPPSTARRVLAEAGVRAAPVTAILRALYGTGSNTSPPQIGRPPPSDRTSAVLRRALLLPDRRVAPPEQGLHLTDVTVLAALLTDQERGVAVAVLGHLGVTGEVRRRLASCYPEWGPALQGGFEVVGPCAR